MNLTLTDRRFDELLAGFQITRIAVLGDFFLDLYIQLDRSLSELSLETNLEAFQAVSLDGLPGAAGVVTNNLTAMGAQTSAVAYTGADGNGYTLRKGLASRGVNIEHLIEISERVTPTYIKPMMREVSGPVVELNRIDVKNRTPNSPELNQELVDKVNLVLKTHDGILVTEQVADDGCGVLSSLLRDALAEAGEQHMNKIIMVDSRHFADRYNRVVLKMNLSEAIRIVGEFAPEMQETSNKDNLALAVYCQRVLYNKTRRPVFITLGDAGISGVADGKDFYFPAFPVSGPIDIVGAGDSVLAGCGLAMCAGASPQEAAYIGNLVGSITIQQIGTTGTANVEDLRERHREYEQFLKTK